MEPFLWGRQPCPSKARDRSSYMALYRSVGTPCELLGTRRALLEQRGKAELSKLTWGEK